MEGQPDRGLVKGAFWLAAAGIISRILGAGYRIPLNRFFGAEIMGMYQMIHPIYQLLVILSTAGFPTALARMVSQERAVGEGREVSSVLLTALIVLGFLGAFFSLFLFFASQLYADRIIMDSRLSTALRLVAPAVFFVFLSTVYRGFFQGLQNMRPFAFSQVVEQFFRVSCTLVLAFLFAQASPHITAAAIVSGTTIGAFCGMAFLLIYYFTNGPTWGALVSSLPSLDEFKVTSSEMLYLAAPITLGGMMTPLKRIVSVAVINRRLILVEGITTSDVQTLYGYFSSYAGTVANLPAVFAISLAAAVVPAVSKLDSLQAKEDLLSTMRSSLKMALMMGTASAVGILMFSREINLFLYADASATVLLQIRALGIVFASISYVTVSILHGLGETRAPLLSLLGGLSIQFVLTYFLTPIPQLNINGAAIARVIGYVSTMGLNFAVLRSRFPRVRFSPHLLAGLGGGLLIMAITSWGTYQLLHYLTSSLPISLLCAIGSAVAVYFCSLLKLEILTEEEIRGVPRYGERMADLLFAEKD